jgi:hypothetical protein|tara:strand:+ start:526 stop:630 length:105 start_codon:yes stop_codon:yes gene_type:complete
VSDSVQFKSKKEEGKNDDKKMDKGKYPLIFVKEM